MTLNGIAVNHSNGAFGANVALQEGHNTIVARAVLGGVQTTDSISLSLDMTPPYITVESHTDGEIVYTPEITITGLVNDIVRGTVEAAQANVTVNGIDAVISNRSYAASDIPLSEGENTIIVNATDQVGNAESLSFKVTYVVPTDRELNIVSGQAQEAVIEEILSEPLVVSVTENDQPVEGVSVVYRVIQGSGAVGAGTDREGRAVVVETNAQGEASTTYKLGARVGAANHKIRASVVGYENQVVFNASAKGRLGNKISVNSGNNQRGGVGQVLPEPLVAVVTDSGANVVAGARVEFKVTVGGGAFANNNSSIYQTVSDSDGRATAELVLGSLVGLDAQRVSVTLLDSELGSPVSAGFTSTAFVPADPGLTSISGVVLDNQDNPLEGVTISVDGTTRKAVSNEEGLFKITEAPVGPVHLIADGSTAIEEGEFPSLSFNLVTVSGVDNPLSAPIYMVKLNTNNSEYVGLDDAEIVLEKIPGFKLEVVKDSVTFPDGSREGWLSVTPVNSSAVPMAPPNGMQPQFIVTIQPTGTRFDPPAKLTLPNVDGHAPGAQVEMYSYDHDLEEFVSIGLGTVSDDGSLVKSNPGVGVVKAGWHCGSQPGGQGCAHNCPICKDCDGECNCVNASGDPRLASLDQPGDCKTPECENGSPVQKDDDSDVAEDEKGDCKKPGCENGSPTTENDDSDVGEDEEGDCKKPGCENGTPKDEFDDSDIKPEDAKCKKCESGELVNDQQKEENKFKCGDGPSQQCYTCKDGKCDHHCEASKDKEVLKVGIPKTVTSWLSYLQRGAGKIRGIAPVSFSVDLGGSASMEQGEACCADCSRSEPVVHNKYEFAGELKATLTAFAGVQVPAVEKYLSRDERFVVRAKAGLEGTLEGKAEPKFSFEEKIGCDTEENDCKTLSGEAGVTGKVSVGGWADAGFQEWNYNKSSFHCKFYNRDARKDPKNDPCWETQEGLSGKIVGSATTGAKVNAAYSECGGGNCTYEVNKTEAKLEADLKISLWLLEFSYEWKPEPVVIFEGLGPYSCGG